MRALLFVLPFFFFAPAQAEVRAFSESNFSQVAYLDLAKISKGFFRSHLRLRLSQRIQAPESVTEHSESSIDDLGNKQEVITAILHGSPIAELTLEVDELDPEGKVIRNHLSQAAATRESRGKPAAKYDFYPSPLHKLHPGEMGGGFRIQDASGKRILLTLTLATQPVFYFDPVKKLVLVLNDPATEVKVTAAHLPAGQEYADGNIFHLREQAVPESLARFARCRKSGESVELSPLVLGLGLLAKRIEHCYPTGGGKFEPIVLIQDNPPHEPADMAKRTLEAALLRGGKVSKAPLFQLNPAEVASANCHGYALLSILGENALPKGAYWVQGAEEADYTSGNQPLAVILRTHFKEVFKVEADYYEEKAELKLARDKRLREGDFITFTGGGGYAHSGVVHRSPDGKSWWIQNKFEEGPVIDMPIVSVHDEIPNLYSEIRIFRKK